MKTEDWVRGVEPRRTRRASSDTSFHSGLTPLSKPGVEMLIGGALMLRCLCLQRQPPALSIGYLLLRSRQSTARAGLQLQTQLSQKFLWPPTVAGWARQRPLFEQALQLIQPGRRQSPIRPRALRNLSHRVLRWKRPLLQRGWVG